MNDRVRHYAPAILREYASISGALIKGGGGLLGIKVGKAEKEIGEAITGRLTTAAKKRERSVRNQIRILLDFVGSVLKTNFHRVIAPGLGNRVAGLQGIVDLDYKERFRTGRK